MALKNRGNFLRWYDEETENVWDRFTFDPDCHSGSPVMLPGEEYTFYCNTPDRVELPIGTDYLKNRAGSTVATGVMTVSSVNLDGPSGGSHSFGSIVIPEGTPTGLYYLQVGDWTTNLIEVVSSTERTLLLSFGNNSSIANIFYEYQSDDFRQLFRIRGYVKDVQPHFKGSEREETTTGLIRAYKKSLRSYKTVIFENLNDEAHQAASLLFIHDKVEINGLSVQPRTEGMYKVLTNESEPYSDGEFQVWDDAFGVLNAC